MWPPASYIRTFRCSSPVGASGLLGARATAAPTTRRASLVAAATLAGCLTLASLALTAVAATAARTLAAAVLDRLGLGIGIGLEARLDALLEVTLDQPLDTLEQATLAIHEHGKALSAVDLLHAEDYFNTVSRDFGHFFRGYDILMTPTVAQLPWKIGEHASTGGNYTARSWTDHVFRDAPFTAVFNVTGQPAISLPLGRSEDGLPFGIQFAADHGREDLLLALAASLEAAQPWPLIAEQTQSLAPEAR